MSETGQEFMKDYPLEKGYQKFLDEVNKIIDGEELIEIKNQKLYHEKPVLPSKEVLNVNYLIRPVPVQCANTGKTTRFFVRLKRFIIRKLKGQP